MSEYNPEYTEPPRGHPFWHPARVWRIDRATGAPKFGQYMWTDRRMITSPAARECPFAARIILADFIGKYGKDTLDGRHGEFLRAVPYSPSDVADHGIAKSTFSTSIALLVDFGFVLQMSMGRKASKGTRAQRRSILLSDAWKASLAPTNSPELDMKENLPRRNDPRTLPKLMALCEQLGSECIWNLYGDYAIKNHFSV